MNSRKTINKIEKNEKIAHKGDLIIEGDVGEQSEINLTDGSLTILGNIHNNAKIILKVSDEMRNRFSNASITSVTQIGGVVFKMGSNMIRGGGISFGESVSAHIAMGDTYIGNVNINNRIFSNDQVTKIGNNKYKITASSSDPLAILFGKSKQPSGSFANATIDGKKYQGKEILVEGEKVFVDSVLANNTTSLNNNNSITEPPKPPVLLVHGNIGNEVIIKSDAGINIKGTIGNKCQIGSDYEGITANNIGDHNIINVRDKIVLEDIGNNCDLTSRQYGLEAKKIGTAVTISTHDTINVKDIGNNSRLTSSTYGINAQDVGQHVYINVHDTINVRNIGNNSQLTSSTYGINARDVGQNVTIRVHDDIKVNDVGKGSHLTSSTYGLKAENISENVVINVHDGIELNKVGDSSQVTSSTYGIKVKEWVGTNAILRGHDAIHVSDVGDGVQLVSTSDKITITNNAGNNVILSAREAIKVMGNIGRSSNITSSSEGVTLGGISSGSVVKAREDIIILGECPEDVSLKSSSGEVIKKKPVTKSTSQKYTHISTHAMVNKNINSFPNVDSFESDLARAIELSKQKEINTTTICSLPSSQVTDVKANLKQSEKKVTGTATKIQSYGGKVQIIVNGKTKTYTGIKGEIGKQGELIIDGLPVKPFDERRVSNNSFSIFSDGEKSKMISKAEQKGYGLEIDSMGNMTYRRK